MRYSIGSDESTPLTDAIIKELHSRGAILKLNGALASNKDTNWPIVAEFVADDVANGQSDQGILLCWTGTGVTMVANKISGIRAALCADAITAGGARQWNDANVLCISLRSTSVQIALEILETWISNTEVDKSELSNINRLKSMDKQEVHS